jgi:LDH2 family malate/lactate/ureidoglycolate dehydrogenase
LVSKNASISKRIYMNFYSKEQLLIFAKSIFRAMGVGADEATMASENLVAADMRGIDSHGVARLAGYWRLHEAGRMVGNAKYTLVHETPGTATLDAGAGLGLVSAEKAMRIAIDKARHVGSGWVAVRNSNHFGIAGRYALMAAEAGMIGFATTNASPLVAPTYGKGRMLGTNPLAFAFPGGKYPPIVVDMATTTAANGKIELLQRKGMDAPLGWLQAEDGSPDTNPGTLAKGGALLPLGSDPERGSHKGYALGAVADLLSGVLSGASFGPWAPPFVSFLPVLEGQPGQGLGHFIGAWRVDAFRPMAEYAIAVERWVEAFKATIPITEGQPVLIPGEPEAAAESIREVDGVPLLDAVVADLAQLATQAGVAPLAVSESRAGEKG